ANNGTIEVDIKASEAGAIAERLKAMNAEVISSLDQTVRARVPLDQLEEIAGWPETIFIMQAYNGVTSSDVSPSRPVGNPVRGITPVRGVSSMLLPRQKPDFQTRAANVRYAVSSALAAMRTTVSARPRMMFKNDTSEGDVAHRAAEARTKFGIDGTGVNIGVLSNGVDSLGTLQGSGDLPAVTGLSGQGGSGDEGSAMLEIVFDLAPGAQLFFATANGGPTNFAKNIRDLRTAGCDIIVDDVFYFVESPFEDGQTGAVSSNTNGGAI